MFLAMKARLGGIRTSQISDTETRITVPRWLGTEGLERAVQGCVDDAWRNGKTVEVERPDERSAVLVFEGKRIELRVRA